MKNSKIFIFRENLNSRLNNYVYDMINRSKTIQNLYSYGSSKLTPFTVESMVADSETKIVVSDCRVDLIGQIRKNRKDIFTAFVNFSDKLNPQDQYYDSLDLMKKNSLNLVCSINKKTELSMVVAPEETTYYVDFNSNNSLKGFFDIISFRSNLNFTRSQVVDGDLISWTSNEVPDSFRTVVNYCVRNNAYKPFGNSTAGHFAVKRDNNTFLTSIRRSNFNNIDSVGLVKVVTEGRDKVIAYGAKPSVGGQSQRIIFENHPELDCILHFHCPILANSKVPIASQKEFECGSHECGMNTSKNLGKFGNLHAVYLDNHGPNIVFHNSIDPKEVIEFVNNNFSLKDKTGDFI